MRLLAPDFIREVHYPEGLSNVVVVKKGQWQANTQPQEGLSEGLFFAVHS